MPDIYEGTTPRVCIFKDSSSRIARRPIGFSNIVIHDMYFELVFHPLFFCRLGIKDVSLAPNVIALWIQQLLMTDLMGTFIAKVAILPNLV